MSSVKELQRLAKEDPKEMIIFNPLLKDFSVYFDNDGSREKHTIRGKDTERFPEPIGKHVKKHLVDFVLNERDGDPMLDREKTEKEVEVKL